MQNFKKNSSTKLFIDYKPAELKQGKDWIIVYYAKVPTKQTMKRFRKRVPKVSSKTERLKIAKKMIKNINDWLNAGGSPFFEENNVKYKSLDDVLNNFIKITEKEVLDGAKREDTIRSYKSYLKIFYSYIHDNYNFNFFTEIDVFTLNNFMEYIYLERNTSPRTYNNYVNFLNTFFIWAVSKGYILKNPAENLKKKVVTKKIREVLGPAEKLKLKKFGESNKEYYTLCMCTYYAFIRRTELTKIKVNEVNLKDGFITIKSENSKNRKTENVTIPKSLYPLLIDHLKNANNSDYLFSNNNFKAGKLKLQPKKVSDFWAKFRSEYSIKSKFQFYSLKDTGITDLLNSGVPSIKVRDQARHHDLKITESYTQRNATFDAIIQNASFKF